MTTRKKTWWYVVPAVILTAVALWLLSKWLIEHHIPAAAGTDFRAHRGQFGDMFGAASCLFSALALVLVAFSTYQEAVELDRQTNTQIWTTNYEYLLEAKKLIAEKDGEKLLELHGIAPGTIARLGVTLSQVTYVIIDLKAADLFYRMTGKKVSLTEVVEFNSYRKNLLGQPLYQKIIADIIVPGNFLGDSDFAKYLAKEFRSTPGR